MKPRIRDKSPGTWLAPQPKSSPREDRGRPGALSGRRWWLGTRQKGAKRHSRGFTQRGACTSAAANWAVTWLSVSNGCDCRSTSWIGVPLENLTNAAR
eukprot:1183509-Pyramimonas_sp.AAC.1